MTDFAALAEAIERERELDAQGKWESIYDGDALETAFLELWARVQALEGALQKIVQEDQRPRFINRHDGGTATNIAFDGRLAEIARAALQPPETDR